MRTHILIVLSNANEGCEEAFNDWYTNRHLDDLLLIDGVHAAQRFELAVTEPPQDASHRYLAIYEVDDDRLDDVRARLHELGVERSQALSAGREPLLSVSDALHADRVAWWFSSITERREAGELATDPRYDEQSRAI